MQRSVRDPIEHVKVYKDQKRYKFIFGSDGSQVHRTWDECARKRFGVTQQRLRQLMRNSGVELASRVMSEPQTETAVSILLPEGLTRGLTDAQVGLWRLGAQAVAA